VKLLIYFGEILKYVIKPLPITRVKTDKSVMTYLLNFSTLLEIGTFAWAIEGDGRRFLVDTGCSAGMQTSSGFPAEQIYTIDEALKSIGWTSKSVDAVILTHLHLDHFAYVEKFRDADIFVQRKEYAAAVNPHPSYRHLYNSDFIKNLFSSLNVKFVDGDEEIADGLSLLFTPGHTPGGQSILVETEKGVAAITGFCCIKENFEPPPSLKDIFKFIVPGIHINIESLYESMLKVEEAADIIIPIHDKSFFNVKSIP